MNRSLLFITLIGLISILISVQSSPVDWTNEVTLTRNERDLVSEEDSTERNDLIEAELAEEESEEDEDEFQIDAIESDEEEDDDDEDEDESSLETLALEEDDEEFEVEALIADPGKETARLPKSSPTLNRAGLIVKKLKAKGGKK